MNRANNLSFWILTVLVFLLPLSFLPTTLIPLGVVKVALTTLGLVALVALFLFETFRSKALALPSTTLLWGALALPIVYILSAVLGSNPNHSLYGYAIEPGTAASIVIFSALFLFAAIYFRDRSRLIRAIAVLFISLGVLAVFFLIKVLTGGNWLVLNTFTGVMGNPVGAWTDLGMAMGLLAIITSFAVEMLPISGLTRWALWIAYALSLFSLMVVNFSTAWVLLLVVSLIMVVYFATVEKREDRGLLSRSGVWMSLVLVVVSLFFLWNPGQFTTQIANWAAVSNADVRPNLSSTVDVSKAVLGSNLLLGMGPHSFDSSWLLYRPEVTNQSIFWNVGFLYGSGFLPTVPPSVGLLGSLAWIFFLGTFFLLGIKALARGPIDRSDRFITISSFLIAFVLWIGSFLYVPSSVVLALAFIFTGIFAAASGVTQVISQRFLALDRNKLTYFASMLSMLALLVGTAAFGRVIWKKSVAVFHFQQAVAYSQAGKSFDQVESELGKAVVSAPADPYWNGVSQIELSKATQAINDSSLSDNDKRDKFQNSLSAAIEAAQNSIKLNPSYENYISLANIYSSLVPAPLNIPGSYEAAKQDYAEAIKRNPLSPEAPLLLAKLEYSKGNTAEALDDVNKAIKLKPDYADAHFTLAQIEVSQNNISEAIKSAETGALLSPGNPGVYFQIGILKYANKDYTGTVDSMQKALAIVPDYANAKYYLGLALDKLGKKDDALKAFEDLATTNPTNELISSAIANIKAGRDALAPATKPSKTLPISGQ